MARLSRNLCEISVEVLIFTDRKDVFNDRVKTGFPDLFLLQADCVGMRNFHCGFSTLIIF